MHNAPTFGHPSEAEIAKLLSSLGIRWEYEPHTFVLTADAAGNTTMEFRPDFYLPDLDRYLEVTVLQQRLVTKKNRKARLARQRYGIVVDILYRRDYLGLAELGLVADLDQLAA